MLPKLEALKAHQLKSTVGVRRGAHADHDSKKLSGNDSAKMNSNVTLKTKLGGTVRKMKRHQKTGELLYYKADT